VPGKGSRLRTGIRHQASGEIARLNPRSERLQGERIGVELPVILDTDAID